MTYTAEQLEAAYREGAKRLRKKVKREARLIAQAAISTGEFACQDESYFFDLAENIGIHTLELFEAWLASRTRQLATGEGK